MKYLIAISMLLTISTLCHAQGSGGYTLFVGEFENRTDIVNPLLSYLTDTLNFLFSRSEIAEIHPISAGLRSAYLQRAWNEEPNIGATQLALLAAEYAQANAALVGFYTKTGAQWTMEAQLYVMREGSRAREDIQLVGEGVYSLLDSLAAEVSKRLGTGQYMLLSTSSWEAYESYRQGHQAYYNFDLMGAIRHFQRAIELDHQLAIAQAELGLSYAMISKLDEAGAAFAEATKNLEYANQQELPVVMGLESFYRYYWVLKKGGGGLAGADMPRMREDTVWDEPWLNRYISETSEDKAVRNRAYKQWLVSAIAYAEAGFYGAPELANAGTEICLDAFNSSGESQFLDAALQFIAQAADMEVKDEYDDAWKHWELANVYEKMNRPEDERSHGEQWLQAVKRKPIDGLSPNTLNDFAGKCLEMGASEDALEFAARAVELESDTELRVLYLVTLADARLASGELAQAFDTYLEAFEIFGHGDVGTIVMTSSLSGLARLVRTNPGFVDEARQAKLNEIMNAIKNTDPLRFRGYSAGWTLYSSTVFEDMRDFCHAVGDMDPLLKLTRSLLKEEASSVGQLIYLSALVSFNGGVSESERNWLSTPGFIRAIGSIGAITDPRKDMRFPTGLGPFQIASSLSTTHHLLGWVYEVIGEPRKAVEAYQKALSSGSLETRMVTSCALMSLYHNLGDAMPPQLHIYFEVEEAESFTPHFEIAEASEASGGKYLWAPDTFDGSHDGQGEAEYTFEIAQPGVYRLVARVLGESSYANGMRISIGENETNLSVGERYAAWNWRSADESFTLPAGKHRLVVHNKDDGVKLDCMVLYREE